MTEAEPDSADPSDAEEYAVREQRGEVNVWGADASISVDTDEQGPWKSIIIDLSPPEASISVHAQFADGTGVQVASMPLTEAVSVLNDHWRTRDGLTGDPLDDWDLDVEEGVIR